MRRSPFDETVKCRKCGWRGPFLLPNRADQQSLFRERRGWIVVRRLARLRPWLERKIYEEATGGASQDETWLATWLSYYWHLLGYTPPKEKWNDGTCWEQLRLKIESHWPMSGFIAWQKTQGPGSTAAKLKA